MSTRPEELRSQVMRCEDHHALSRVLFYSDLVREHAKLCVAWKSEGQGPDRKVTARIMEQIAVACVRDNPVLKTLQEAPDVQGFQCVLGVLVGGIAAEVLRPQPALPFTLPADAVAEQLIAQGRDREVVSYINEFNGLADGFLAGR